MKSLSMCKHCKQVIQGEAFKFGKGLFCCPEHAAAFYENIKSNPSKLRISGITDEELKKIQEVEIETLKMEEKEPEVSTSDTEIEDVFDGTESTDKEVTPVTTQADDNVQHTLLSREEDYLMPVYYLFGEITNGMTNTPEALNTLKERTKDINLINLYYLLYDKKEGLANIFNHAVCYNSYGAMAYMIGAAKNMMKYYNPVYITPNTKVDNIETNYYHPEDSDYQIVNKRIPLDSLFSNSNEEDDLI